MEPICLRNVIRYSCFVIICMLGFLFVSCACLDFKLWLLRLW